MQTPTCRGIHLRSLADADRILHGVYTKSLRIIDRRLNTEERRAIQSGDVYVWEERGPNDIAPGVERWVDSIPWGPSRVRDGFRFYDQKSRAVYPNPSTVYDRAPLVKQTYSAFVATEYGQRKWHLMAYFSPETVEQLGSVDDIPALATPDETSGEVARQDLSRL